MDGRQQNGARNENVSRLSPYPWGTQAQRAIASFLGQHNACDISQANIYD